VKICVYTWAAYYIDGYTSIFVFLFFSLFITSGFYYIQLNSLKYYIPYNSTNLIDISISSNNEEKVQLINNCIKKSYTFSKINILEYKSTVIKKVSNSNINTTNILNNTDVNNNSIIKNEEVKNNFFDITKFNSGNDNYVNIKNIFYNDIYLENLIYIDYYKIYLNEIIDFIFYILNVLFN
jgi:hypothetical protein